MVFCTLPNCLEDIRLAEKELYIVVCPGGGRETLQEDDHFLCVRQLCHHLREQAHLEVHLS